jgi:hypothetical protein
MQDKIMPPTEVQKVFDAAGPGSELIEVDGATHEAVPYYFEVLGPAVNEWLEMQTRAGEPISSD